MRIRLGRSVLLALLGMSAGRSVLAQAPSPAAGTQVVQRGSGGAPSYILDDTQQWSVPVLVAQTEGVDLYVQDTSDPQWLARNYRDFPQHRTMGSTST